MNVFVNILKILIILVAIVIGVALLLLAALVLFPGFSLFGLHYISGDGKTVGHYINLDSTAEENYVQEWNNTNTVSIITTDWDIEVRPVDKNSENNYMVDTITALFTHRYNGFVYGDVNEPSLKTPRFVEQTDGSYTLVYEVAEPGGGWLSKTDTKLVILFDPEDFVGKNLDIQTRSGIVKIGNNLRYEQTDDSSNSKKVSVDFTSGDISVSDESGAVTIGDVNVNGEVRVDKNSGDFTSQVNLNENVFIDISGGFGKISLKNVGTSAGETGLILQEIHNSNITFDTVKGDLSFIGSGGLIRGENVEGTLSVDGGNCDVILTKVDGIINWNSTDGSLELKAASSNVLANCSGSGQINIESILGNANISTNSGAINLPDTKANVTAKSNGGAITINGSNNTATYDVSSRSGRVTLSNVCGNVIFNATDNGNASLDVSYISLQGENVLNSQTGEIKVTVGSKMPFFLEGWSTNNSVNIDISACRSNASKSADTEFANGVAINGGSVSNSLLITSISGSISIGHTNA